MKIILSENVTFQSVKKEIENRSNNETVFFEVTDSVDWDYPDVLNLIRLLREHELDSYLKFKKTKKCL